MSGFDVLAFVMFWLTGLVAFLFPQAVIGYSRWKHRHQPGWVPSMEAGQVRNVASVYLMVLTALTLAGWYRAS